MKLSRASAPRSDWAEIVKDRMSKSLTRKTKTNYTLMDVLTELSKTECMLEVTSLKL